jgi:hypothetical protein
MILMFGLLSVHHFWHFSIESHRFRDFDFELSCAWAVSVGSRRPKKGRRDRTGVIPPADVPAIRVWLD